MTTETKPPFVIGYVRVSTDKQELSVEAQTAAVNRAIEYHRFPHGVILAEPDTSGGIPFEERPQGKLLFAKVQQYAVTHNVVVIFPKVDRVGRSAIDIQLSVQRLEKLGARMLFLDINVDTRTAQGRAFMGMAAVFAELERDTIRDRIQTALDHKRANGQCLGTCPYGWDAVPTGQTTPRGVAIKRLEDNLGEQKWILKMSSWRKAGWSWGMIARELNRLNVPTKAGKGNVVKYKGELKVTSGKWHEGKVYKVLNNKTVQAWLAQLSGDLGQLGA